MNSKIDNENKFIVKKKKRPLKVFLNYICLPIALITIVGCVCNFVIELKETRKVVNDVSERLDEKNKQQEEEIQEYRNNIYGYDYEYSYGE